MEIAAIIFLVIMLAVAYIAFRALKKTLQMAMRAVIVLVIAFIAVIGGITLWTMGGNTNTEKVPAKTKKSP